MLHRLGRARPYSISVRSSSAPLFPRRIYEDRKSHRCTQKSPINYGYPCCAVTLREQREPEFITDRADGKPASVYRDLLPFAGI